jgi:hypothetical protein
MRAQNKITPAIMANPEAQKIYTVTIDLGNGRWAELNFSEREMATSEYNRIKGMGIYCSCWIKSVSIADRTE